MSIKHAVVKAPNQPVAAVADWNADHIGTAAPDAHGNAAHTSVFITGAQVPANETDPVYTAWDKDHADLSNVTSDQHHAKSHSITSTTDHTSTATSGKMLKADANGLPINATNTDAQVSAAVTASHAAVTISDTASIDLSLAGQQISGAVLPAGVDHNSLNNYSANKHIDHTAVTLTLSSPLSGSGDISANRTFSIANAAADGATKGAAAFNATNFSAVAGVVNTIQNINATASPQFANVVITNEGDIRPSADSTTAINIAQADGTNFVAFDTTNKRVGIGTASPGTALDVVGAVTSRDDTAPIYNFKNTAGTTKGVIKYLMASDTLQVYVGGTAAANIAFSFSGAGFQIGGAAAGVDYTLSFNGETYDGAITWMEDEDYFKFSDDILMNGAEKIYFRDTAISINSGADGYMDLNADSGIRLQNKITTYNGIATGGYGVPAIVNDFGAGGMNTDFGPISIPGTNSVGVYFVYFYVFIDATEAGTETVTPYIKWNDGTARTFAGSSVAFAAANYSQQRVYINNVSGNFITYQFNLNEALESGSYNFHVTTQRMS